MSTSVHPEAAGSTEVEGRGKKRVIKLYPYADLFEAPMMADPLTPLGITVHYTAGATARSSISHLMNSNLGYHLIIDRDGSVWQMYSLESRCSHAGNAEWNGLSPNRNHIAVAVCSFGLLTPSDHGPGFQNMYGREVFSVAHRRGKYWEPATHEQEDILLEVCLWLCRYLHIQADNICGHHECAIPKGRKIDPGGVLGYSMENFRGMVKNLLQRPHLVSDIDLRS